MLVIFLALDGANRVTVRKCHIPEDDFLLAEMIKINTQRTSTEQQIAKQNEISYEDDDVVIIIRKVYK